MCTCDTPLAVLITSGGSDYKLIYRHYATLYFVFCVDSSESELGILDLIQVGQGTSQRVIVTYNKLPSTQVFVETLDKCFENVCELDLIFHMDKVPDYVVRPKPDHKFQVHWILNELVMGGMVLETNMSEIMLRIEEQNKIEKEEVRLKDKKALKTCLKMYKWLLKFSFLVFH